MSNAVKQGKTLSGKIKYTVTVKTPIGNTTYVRTNWSDIIDILNDYPDNEDNHDRWYGNGKFMGD